jgi:hypothetical protein
MNHLSAQATFKVKNGVCLAAHRDAVHFSLHYTAEGSSAVNDLVLRSSPVVDERQERVPGVRTKYLTDGVPPEQAARISCTLGLPDGSRYVSLASADPKVQSVFNIATSSIRTTFGGCGKACDWRRDCSNPMRIGTWPITGSILWMTSSTTTMVWTSGSARP